EQAFAGFGVRLPAAAQVFGRDQVAPAHEFLGLVLYRGKVQSAEEAAQDQVALLMVCAYRIILYSGGGAWQGRRHRVLLGSVKVCYRAGLNYSNSQTSF